MGTFAKEYNLETETEYGKLSAKINRTLQNNVSKARNQAITLTISTRGHQIDPWQADRYHVVTMMRRMLQKREDLKEAIRKLIEEGEEDRGETPMNGKQLKMNKLVKHSNKFKEATGPLHTLNQICQDLGWSINKDFIITRENGGNISFLKGEDKIFTHLIRMDLRKAVWNKNKELNKPEKKQTVRSRQGNNIRLRNNN